MRDFVLEQQHFLHFCVLPFSLIGWFGLKDFLCRSCKLYMKCVFRSLEALRVEAAWVAGKNREAFIGWMTAFT
jgi:hypothetical protein